MDKRLERIVRRALGDVQAKGRGDFLTQTQLAVGAARQARPDLIAAVPIQELETRLI
jgi:hypothetical protein